MKWLGLCSSQHGFGLCLCSEHTETNSLNTTKAPFESLSQAQMAAPEGASVM